MESEIGTLAWGEITKGRLKGRDRKRQLLDLLGVSRSRSEATHPAMRFDLDEIIVPDSTPARRAAEECREASSEALANHSLRSYFWGALLALNEKRDYDAETFFVAAMMHDIALTEKHEFCNGASHCFALEGADITLREAPGWGLDEARTRTAAEAIALHLNVNVSATRHGNEAYLLNAGTALDLLGARRERIHPDNRADVLERAPRGSLTRELTRDLSRQAKERPDCRMAFLWRNGFGDRMAKSPFEKETTAAN